MNTAELIAFIDETMSEVRDIESMERSRWVANRNEWVIATCRRVSERLDDIRNEVAAR